MRKQLLTISLLTAILMVFSCTKESEENTVKDTIEGRWTFEHLFRIRDSATIGIEERFDTAYIGDYFDFQSGGALSMRIYGEDESGTWSVDDEEQLRLVRTNGSDTIYRIAQVNAQTIQLQYYEENNSGSIMQVYQLKR